MIAKNSPPVVFVVDDIERIQRALAKDAEGRAGLEGQQAIRAHLESLTQREREVLALLVRGKPNRAMAHELGVSQRTIESHRARVMEKSGASSLAELIRMVMDVEPELIASHQS